MKKIMSLLLATALSVTAFTSLVSAQKITADNKATLALSSATERELDFDDEDKDVDQKAFLEEQEIDDGYTVYRFKITAGNLPKLTKPTNSTYLGEGITAVAAKVTVVTSAIYGKDWIIIPSKGGVTPDGNDYVVSYNGGDSNYATLLYTTAVSEGGSKDLLTFDMIIKNNFSYTVSLGAGSNMNAAVYGDSSTGTGTAKSAGTGKYNIIAAASNIEVDATEQQFGSEPDPDPEVYTVIFMNEDGTDDIQDNDYDEGDYVTAPDVPAKAGYHFVGWSESIGGATVTPISTATANKTYYAVYAKDAGVVDPDGGNVGVADTTTGVLKALDGSDVELTKNYGITKFSTALDPVNYDYYLIVEDDGGTIKDENSANPFKIDFDADHIETSGTVSFFALVHSTTHFIKSIVLKAVAK